MAEMNPNAAAGVEPVWVHGHRMYLHDFAKDRWLSPVLAAGRLFEPLETCWMQNLIRPGDVVLDIGGHIGFYTLQFARFVGPRGRVFTFEPDPTNFELLQRNVLLSGYTTVSMYNVAVSNKAETTSLYLCGDNAGDHRIWPAAETRPSVSVSTIVLDQFFGNHQQPIDCIKMDIQGAEGAALEGMKNLLRKQPNITLFLEFWPFGLRSAGGSGEQVVGLLVELGFRLFLFHEARGQLTHIEPRSLLQLLDPEKDVFVNLLCIKRTFPSSLGP